MIKYSPDHSAIKGSVNNKIKAFRATHPGEEPGVVLVKKYIDEAFNEYAETLVKCSLKPLKKETLQAAIEAVFIKESLKDDSQDTSAEDSLDDEEIDD